MTDLDRLKADPFAFYAQRVLRLRRLDSADADPSAAWRGSAVHAVLEAWMREDDCDPDRLAPRARILLDQAHPVMRALWKPRLDEAIGFIATEMARIQAAGRRPLAAELEGRCDIEGLTVRGRADRIDVCADGRLAIIDYKTGKPPSVKAVEQGFSLQLGLLGLIAQAGGFPGLGGEVAQFEYWSLARGRDGFGYVKNAVGPRTGGDAAGFADGAHRSFLDSAGKWLLGSEPFVAKVHPEYAPYGDYDQLMRFDEWYGRD